MVNFTDWTSLIKKHKATIHNAVQKAYRKCLHPGTVYTWIEIMPDGRTFVGAIILSTNGNDMELDDGEFISARTITHSSLDALGCHLLPGAYLAPVADIIDTIGFDFSWIWQEILGDAAYRDSGKVC